MPAIIDKELGIQKYTFIPADTPEDANKKIISNNRTVEEVKGEIVTKLESIDDIDAVFRTGPL